MLHTCPHLCGYSSVYKSSISNHLKKKLRCNGTVTFSETVTINPSITYLQDENEKYKIENTKLLKEIMQLCNDLSKAEDAYIPKIGKLSMKIERLELSLKKKDIFIKNLQENRVISIPNVSSS
jgi:hypothetical protein